MSLKHVTFKMPEKGCFSTRIPCALCSEQALVTTVFAMCYNFLICSSYYCHYTAGVMSLSIQQCYYTTHKYNLTHCSVMGLRSLLMPIVYPFNTAHSDTVSRCGVFCSSMPLSVARQRALLMCFR